MNSVSSFRKQGKNFFQRLDPRVKIITFTVFILFIGLTPPGDFYKFLAYLFLLGVFFTLSSVPFKRWVSRLALIFPLLAFIGLSVILFKQDPQWTRGEILWNLGVKTVLIFMSVLLLVLSTGFYRLVKGLELLKVPSLVISVVTFAYRYSFLLSQEAESMRKAKLSRSFGRRKKTQEVKTLMHMVPHLFFRTFERSERIYAAMLSRGFDRKVKTLILFRMKTEDWIFGFLFFLALGLIRGML
ncbi:cobalt ECF transporter T component CbiQ [bacterium]|nr:cobalt ECF transporter T component CbiQ [bacterium]